MSKGRAEDGCESFISARQWGYNNDKSNKKTNKSNNNNNHKNKCED